MVDLVAFSPAGTGSEGVYVVLVRAVGICDEPSKGDGVLGK